MAESKELDGKGQDDCGANSHLFLLRVWESPGGPGTPDVMEVEGVTEAGAAGVGTTEYRGRLQHVLTGESRSFSSILSLVETLASMLPSAAQPALPKLDGVAEGL